MNARNMSICVYKNFELSRAFPYERMRRKCKTANYGMGRQKKLNIQ